jgi:hypothetical protein
VRTNFIVLLAPLLDDDLSRLQGVENFTVEQLIPELAIEALDIAARVRVPRTAWLDE